MNKEEQALAGQSSYWRRVLNPPKGPRLPRPSEQIKVRQGKRLKDLENKIEAKKQELEALREAAKEETRNQRIVCPHCNKQPKLKDCTYIQTYWYTRPYGCSGGDYWNQGEGRFKCPHCGKITRLYERPEIEALKWAFGKVEDLHDE